MHVPGGALSLSGQFEKLLLLSRGYDIVNHPPTPLGLGGGCSVFLTPLPLKQKRAKVSRCRDAAQSRQLHVAKF